MKQGGNGSALVFIEHVRFFSFMFQILPWVLEKKRAVGRNKLTVYYVAASPAGAWLAQQVMAQTGIRIGYLHFSLGDIYSDEGTLLLLHLIADEYRKVVALIDVNPAFHAAVRNADDNTESGFASFMRKQALGIVSGRTNLIHRALELVALMKWRSGLDMLSEAEKTIFMDQRLWCKEISAYAGSYGVGVFYVTRIKFDLKNFLHICVGENRLKMLWYGVVELKRKILLVCSREKRSVKVREPGLSTKTSSGRVMTNYYGQPYLDNPENFSDLFFCQQSKLKAEDVVVTLNLPDSPLKNADCGLLEERGFSVIALNPKAGPLDRVELFVCGRDVDRPGLVFADFFGGGGVCPAHWLECARSLYLTRRLYWSRLFLKTNTLIYTSWYKYDASYSALGDALRAHGGIVTSYQRAFEVFPSPLRAVNTDVFFGFSKLVGQVEQENGSKISSFVVTGYIGDYRYQHLRPLAGKIRFGLEKNGARKILSFFDENSSSDSRWGDGHSLTRGNYSFFLNKVLNEPWLGLVIKPKVPLSLRKRLGPVVRLLEEALKTGRCYLVEDNSGVQGACPPALAALASDIAIHGHLFAITAAIDAAFAGVPTLCIDKEGAVGLRGSVLRGRVSGEIVFNDRDALWLACCDHWGSAGGNPRLGNWDGLLQDLDPFRDGRAAERIGTYLLWLLDGLKSGRSREEVLAECAHRYGNIWGKDKVFSVG